MWFCWFCKIQPWTERQAHDNSIYRASIASRRKNTADNIGTKCRRHDTVNTPIHEAHRRHSLAETTLLPHKYVFLFVDTARIACGAGSMKRSNVRPSVCVCPSLSHRWPGPARLLLSAPCRRYRSAAAGAGAAYKPQALYGKYAAGRRSAANAAVSCTYVDR